MSRRDARIPLAILLAVAAWSGDTSAAEPDMRHDPHPADWYVHEAVHAAPIPVFARMYGTGCSTCHVAAPKLNVFGEAFRLAGYRMPENELLVRRDDPVPLGAEPWKDQWPRSIWPSTLPGQSPIALRVQSDIRVLGRSDGTRDLDFVFPNELYILGGAPIGEDISTFVEAEWSESRGFNVVQAKVAFQDFLPGLPSGAANLSVGRQDPFLLTFTDRQIDRAGILGFSWQFFSPAVVALSGPGGATLRSANGMALGFGVPSVEVNGIIRGRLHYGAGISQGGLRTSDNNDAKDPYYRLRYKFGGLDLRGRYDPGDEPVLGTGGQLQDRSLIVEHFGYRGNESTTTDPQGSHWSTGVAARVLYGPWDAGVGLVRRRYDRPYDTASGAMRGKAIFAKVEYMIWPWLLGSLKYDRLDVSIDDDALPAGFTLDPADRRSVAPGAVLVLRQNVRAIVEGRFYGSGDARQVVGEAPPELFVRLDLIF